MGNSCKTCSYPFLRPIQREINRVWESCVEDFSPMFEVRVRVENSDVENSDVENSDVEKSEVHTSASDVSENEYANDDSQTSHLYKPSCPVCLRTLNQLYVSECGHVYCKACFQKTKRKHHECVICRTEWGDNTKKIKIYGLEPVE